MLAFIFVGAVYVARNIEEFRSISMPSALAITVVIVGFVASVFFRALYNYVTSRHLGAQLSLSESFMLSSVVTAGNITLPANPGAAFRAVYLKRVHRFSYAHFASSTALFIIITTMMMSIVGLVLVLLIQIRLDYFRSDLFFFLLAIALLTGVSIMFDKSRAPSNTGGIWSSFKSGYLVLTSARRLIVVCLLVVSSNFMVASAVWFVALTDYAPDLSALEAFLFSASQIASGLINLTPGAAGFQEIVGFYVGKSFSISAAELFAALIWVRVVRTLAAISLGSVCAVGLRLRIDR